MVSFQCTTQQGSTQLIEESGSAEMSLSALHKMLHLTLLIMLVDQSVCPTDLLCTLLMVSYLLWTLFLCFDILQSMSL